MAQFQTDAMLRKTDGGWQGSIHRGQRPPIEVDGATPDHVIEQLQERLLADLQLEDEEQASEGWPYHVHGHSTVLSTEPRTHVVRVAVDHQQAHARS